jgi:hypothetical protein
MRIEAVVYGDPVWIFLADPSSFCLALLYRAGSVDERVACQKGALV